MESIVWVRKDDEHFALKLNGVDLGTWHLSQMRHFIQETDNAIEYYSPTVE